MKSEAFLIATLLWCFAAAELRVWRPESQSSQSEDSPSVRELQACEVIDWTELCERSQTLTLTAGCFQLQPSETPIPSCQLRPRGPSGTLQLRPVAAGVVTLQTSGELRITGRIEMTSLRFEAETLIFEDAEVEARHELPDRDESIEFGGAFYARSGSFSLMGSNLTVRDTAAVHGGGLAAGGDLTLQHSNVFIERVSASKSGAGFFAQGNAVIENSSISIGHALSRASAGGFEVRGRLQVIDRSTVDLHHVTALAHGGGFVAGQEVMVAGNSILNISNSNALVGDGGGFYIEHNFKLFSSSLMIRYATAGRNGGGFLARGDATAGSSILNISDSHAESGEGGGFVILQAMMYTNSTLFISNAAAGKHGGGFLAYCKVVISSSMVLIRNASAAQIGGGFATLADLVIANMSNLSISNALAGDQGGGFEVDGRLQVSGGSMVHLQDVAAGNNGGGFLALRDVTLAGSSGVNISNSLAGKKGGGFATANSFTMSLNSTVMIWNARAGDTGGGFYAFQKVVISGSTFLIRNASTLQTDGGGFEALSDLIIANMSNLSISNAWARRQGGGFQVEGRLQVSTKSTVNLHDVTAGVHGGGFVVGEEMVIGGSSILNISNSHAGSGQAGGFNIVGSFIMDTNSTLCIRNATARTIGGGFCADKVVISSSTVLIRNVSTQIGGGFSADTDLVIANMSNLSISNAWAGHQGGGFQLYGRLQVSTNSTVNLHNVAAGGNGGGFVAIEDVVIGGSSVLNISNSHADSESAGAFYTSKSFMMSTNSTLSIWKATAGKHGGGFHATGEVVISSSTVRIQHANARLNGGGFQAEGHMQVSNRSTVNLDNVTAGVDGGGFLALQSVTLAGSSSMNITNSQAESGVGGAFRIAKGLTLSGSWMSVNKSTGVGLGTASHVVGPMLLDSESNFIVHGADGPGNSSVLEAHCLQLNAQSNILLEDVTGGHAMKLKNSCKKGGGCANTFEVASDATLKASGRLTSGLLAVEACPNEKIHLTGIHLQGWSSALVTTQGGPGFVVVDRVRIDYEAPLTNLPVLAVKDGYKVDSLTASCLNCSRGFTFDSREDGRFLALSPENLQCSKTATLSKGSTRRCECADYQITRDDFRDKEMVPLESIFDTCKFCEPHSYYQNDENGTCGKCGLLSGWSDGKKDHCHTWPRKQNERVILLMGPAIVVLIIFVIFEILKTPLTILEAKSSIGNIEQGEAKKTFTFSVQGPIVGLHKSLSRLLHQRISYCAQGTDLAWLDYDKSEKAIKVSTIARRKLMIENMQVPFDCAACKGALQAIHFGFPLTMVVAFVTLAVMLPVIIKIVVISGNGVAHVAATALYALVPMAAVAALLHMPTSWLLRWLYRRTPFREMLAQYEKQICCTPFSGPDPDHPSNQGLEALTLLGLWQHFEGFLVERNMHFVVSNIVRPLTQSKRVSFVNLWGGRQVDFFVSHSWGTDFQHFVRSIERHACSKEGPNWSGAAYWICSFANNQWNIEAELGSDPMTSAFARALTSGIKGVAMVLDQEVQPLTRVWCLFEFLLASRERLELVFVTDAGVVGDDGCTSVDIALAVGRKIKSLQVATCQASSEKDKKDIFDFIINQLGSLERMDVQIRSLMGNMLVKNLSNVGHATDDLLKELGQKLAIALAVKQRAVHECPF